MDMCTQPDSGIICQRQTVKRPEEPNHKRSKLKSDHDIPLLYKIKIRVKLTLVPSKQKTDGLQSNKLRKTYVVNPFANTLFCIE